MRLKDVVLFFLHLLFLLSMVMLIVSTLSNTLHVDYATNVVFWGYMFLLIRLIVKNFR